MRRPKHITAKQRTAASFNRAVVRRYLPLLAEALERYVADRFDEVRARIGFKFKAADINRQWWADNPAEALRDIAERAGYEVDHEEIERWAKYADAPPA